MIQKQDDSNAKIAESLHVLTNILYQNTPAQREIRNLVKEFLVRIIQLENEVNQVRLIT